MEFVERRSDAPAPAHRGSRVLAAPAPDRIKTKARRMTTVSCRQRRRPASTGFRRGASRGCLSGLHRLDRDRPSRRAGSPVVPGEYHLQGREHGPCSCGALDEGCCVHGWQKDHSSSLPPPAATELVAPAEGTPSSCQDGDAGRSGVGGGGLPAPGAPALAPDPDPASVPAKGAACQNAKRRAWAAASRPAASTPAALCPTGVGARMIARDADDGEFRRGPSEGRLFSRA